MPLSRLTIRNTKFFRDDETGIDVFHVNDSHALVQAAGYLKFTHAPVGTSEGIYFRGEQRLHGNLQPGLFRGADFHGPKSRRTSLVNVAVRTFRESCRIFTDFGEYAHEPLLQHYGITTTWIDLVDNLWVALWFACHVARSSGSAGQYLHFERRLPDAHEYAYILLVGVDINRRDALRPGYYFGQSTEFVDLRMATPSIFLRPHAQHGLVFRCRGINDERPSDYWSQVRGVIRVSLSNALDWLGTGKIVGVHALFPPPYYDNGYRILLECGVSTDRAVGGIMVVGA